MKRGRKPRLSRQAWESQVRGYWLANNQYESCREIAIRFPRPEDGHILSAQRIWQIVNAPAPEQN